MHALIGAGLLTQGKRADRRVFLVAALPPAATCAWLAAQAPTVLDGGVVTETVSWVATLDLSVAVRVDGFSAVMVALVAGIGVLVQAYAARYFDAGTPELGRLVGLLTLFTGAMLGLVTADNLLWLYVCWELTSVTSYLLIGWRDTDAQARASALQALLITVAGGLAMLGGFVVIGQAAGTYQLSAILDAPPSGTAVSVGLVLVVLGAITKSAQLPFSSWLPGAMVAPTPISAYLHSATMVKAGVYLIARFAPAFAEEAVWRPLVLTVGLVTMIGAGARALRQYDLKRLLAFGTVSQLGFMITLLGAGMAEATEAGVALVIAHALFKAALFMVVGVIDHQADTRDIRALGSFAEGWAGVRWVAILSAASMAGVPLLFGFIAKEAAYDAFAHGDIAGGPVVLAGLVVGSVLTFAYSGRLLLGAFRPGGAAEAGTDEDPEPAPTVPAPRWSAWAPAAVLAVPTVILGVVPGLASQVVSVASASLDPRVEAIDLKLWHGVNLALGLSAVTIATGVVMVMGGDLVARAQSRLGGLPDGNAAYLWALRNLNRAADRVTGVVQSGSLPTYAGVILATAVAVPGFVLVTGTVPATLPVFADSAGEVATVALTVAAGLAAAIVRRRLAAVVCLGAVGYGMAMVFVLRGAPDLALTQLAIETLGAVLFVLVLRRLPDRFAERPTPLGRLVRLGIAGAVGTFVFVFALVASASREAEPVSDAYLRRALPDGGGSNVVNVILVDFRGFDTLGEITVLAVAALGIVALARAVRRPTDVDDDGQEPAVADSEVGG